MAKNDKLIDMIDRQLVERFGPSLVGLLAAVLSWRLGSPLSADVAKNLLPALLSASAISAGFMTTALSVLLPIAGTAIGRRLKRRGKFDLLFSYLRSAIYSCIALAVVSVIGLVQVDPALGMDKNSTILLVAVATFSVASFIRILEILIQILPQMAEPEDRDG